MKRSNQNAAADSSPGKHNGYHTPVLLKEAINALSIKPNGIYVDCTFGGGGHGREILKRLNEAGKLALHGWHYVLEDGEIHVFDVRSGQFVPAAVSPHSGTGPYQSFEEQSLDRSGTHRR